MSWRAKCIIIILHLQQALLLEWYARQSVVQTEPPEQSSPLSPFSQEEQRTPNVKCKVPKNKPQRKGLIQNHVSHYTQSPLMQKKTPPLYKCTKRGNDGWRTPSPPAPAFYKRSKAVGFPEAKKKKT